MPSPIVPIKFSISRCLQCKLSISVLSSCSPPPTTSLSRRVTRSSTWFQGKCNPFQAHTSPMSRAASADAKRPFEGHSLGKSGDRPCQRLGLIAQMPSPVAVSLNSSDTLVSLTLIRDQVQTLPRPPHVAFNCWRSDTRHPKSSRPRGCATFRTNFHPELSASPRSKTHDSHRGIILIRRSDQIRKSILTS
jgi:hypothetical protein